MTDRLKDVPELARDGSNLGAVMSSIREVIQTFRGYRGDPLDAALTRRTAIATGILNADGTAVVGAGGGSVGPAGPAGPAGPSGGTYTPDLTAPPTASGLTVTAGIGHIYISCDQPVYTQGHGHDLTVVYGAKWPSGAAPTFGSAVELMRFQGTFDAYASDPNTRWCIWIKWLSVDDVLSVSPAGGTNGVQATTGQDITTLLEVLAGEITATELHSSLGTRINLIDAPTTGLVTQVAGLTTTYGSTASAASSAAAAAASQAAAIIAQGNATTAATTATTQAGNAATSATNAATSASSASTSATNAAGSASTASTNATTATNAATAAGGSATAASTSASNAATSATNSGNSATAANASQVAAASSQSTAAGSAAAAAASAITASTSATNAGTSATSASTSATTATTQASNASVSASNAATSATSASGSATSAATSVTTIQATLRGISLGLPLAQWTLNGHSIVTLSDGKVGNKALRLVGNGLFPNQGAYVPLDRTKTYRIRFWARPSATNTAGLLYFSLRQFTNDTGTPGPVNGGRSPYKPSGVSRATHNTLYGTDAWGEYSYTWTSADWQSGVMYVLPEFLDNFSGQSGHWEIQDFTFTDISEVTAAVQVEATARASETGNLFAQYTVKLDVNGKVSGFGLASTGPTGTGSTFEIRADKFSIAAPTGSAAGAVPFTVLTTPTTIGGVNFSAGVYATQAFILDAQITNAKIVDLAVDNAKIANLNVSKLLAGSLAVGQYVRSTTYTGGSAGFTINADGTAEFNSVTVRGTVYATAGEFRGVDVKNAAGTVILSAGSSIQSQIAPYSSGATVNQSDATTNAAISSAGTTATWIGVTGSNRPADNATVGATIGVNLGGQITSGNASTYIASAAIGDAQIGTLNAAKINAGFLSVDRLQIGTVTQVAQALSSFVTVWSGAATYLITTGFTPILGPIVATTGGNVLITISGYARITTNSTVSTTIHLAHKMTLSNGTTDYGGVYCSSMNLYAHSTYYYVPFTLTQLFPLQAAHATYRLKYETTYLEAGNPTATSIVTQIAIVASQYIIETKV